MAPNPIILQRKQASPSPRRNTSTQQGASGLTTSLIATSVLVLLVATVSWARRWLYSGAAIESLLLIYGHGKGDRIFASLPLWALLAAFNLVYAICSTSWLLLGLFTAVCYPSIFLTSLFQSVLVADFARRSLRKALGELHFTRDKIALFNLPALEIDVDVDGLMVIRGVTISISTLTIVVHGVEVGLKLADDIELALYADEVKISLFRRVEVGEVYGNVKGGKSEMTFGELDEDGNDGASDDIFMDSTPLLRAATLKSEEFKDRPKLRQSFTGVSYMKDSSPQSVLDSVTTLSPDDEEAEKKYHKILTEIRTESTVYQSRQQVRKKAKSEDGFTVEDEKDMRAAICAELHNLPSIAHPPIKSVRVSTLKQMSPPHVRDFMHRLPFLLRLLLAVLSYFHALSFASISVAGSGQWLSALLQQNVFKQYTESNSDLRRLERKVSQWLANANFCLQLTGIDGLGSVPLSTAFDIVAYLKFHDIMAYRTVPDTGTIAQVVRLGGADATVTIPSYLLPHHEHLVPEKATDEEEQELEVKVEDADGAPKTKQAEMELKTVQKDETNIAISVHASLPATFDQSLLNFVAALVKATKMIEMEKEAGEVEEGVNDSGDATPNGTKSPASIAALESEFASDPSLTRSSTGSTFSEKSGGEGRDKNFKAFASRIQQSLQKTTANVNIKDFVKDLHQSTKDGVKKVVVGGMVNDRWIAKLVGRAAASLQNMQGDVGYSGKIPVPLASYRGAPGLASKILP